MNSRDLLAIAVAVTAFGVACSEDTTPQVAAGRSPTAEAAILETPTRPPATTRPAAQPPTETPVSPATQSEDPRATAAAEPAGTNALPTPTGSLTPTPTATSRPAPTATPTFDTQRLAGSYDGVTFLVSEGSEATFTVTEQLARLPLPNDAVMRTTGLRGDVRLDGGSSVFTINLHQLSSDNNFRDRYVRTRMFPNDRFATFTVSEIGSMPEAFATGEPIATTVAGRLTIKGEDIPLHFEVEARDDGDVIFIVGRTTFTWDQLKLPKPRARLVVSLEDEVKVEVLLALRPVLATP